MIEPTGFPPDGDMGMPWILIELTCRSDPKGLGGVVTTFVLAVGSCTVRTGFDDPVLRVKY
jgi:hypothetical protein